MSYFGTSSCDIFVFTEKKKRICVNVYFFSVLPGLILGLFRRRSVLRSRHESRPQLIKRRQVGPEGLTGNVRNTSSFKIAATVDSVGRKTYDEQLSTQGPVTDDTLHHFPLFALRILSVKIF